MFYSALWRAAVLITFRGTCIYMYMYMYMHTQTLLSSICACYMYISHIWQKSTRILSQ